MADAVISSERLKSDAFAMTERINMDTATAIPVGMENPRILLINLFLMRSVFFSSAKTIPGNPIQAKFSNDISSGAYGYSSGIIIKIIASMAA